MRPSVRDMACCATLKVEPSVPNGTQSVAGDKRERKRRTVPAELDEILARRTLAERTNILLHEVNTQSEDRHPAQTAQANLVEVVRLEEGLCEKDETLCSLGVASPSGVEAP